jgi:hypothetical protein
MEKKGGASRGGGEKGWKEGVIGRERNKGWKGKEEYAKE